MEKQIKLHNRKIKYILKTSKRAKRMRLAIYCDSSFVVTRPYGLSRNIVEKFIIKKSNWILSKLEYFNQFKNSYLLKSDRKEYLKYKEKSLNFVCQRIKYHNKKNVFRFNKINIKNQKTRWGSCSRKGNLNFNYKILFLPKQMADYIVIHELCHLKEFNHSRKFWNLVGKIVPDYLIIKEKFRNHTTSLHKSVNN